ncbi:division/cell wall cluster transcriptional repressor MraZ [Geomesophilobacter sediminis]|uniref:Transcriptional regulator MraZ n=1 Tax=Geomesophilobacter sediminis TaxID=2798584 RepID=A0A8J7SBX7_9BACT|nr:division/cell wall cluster transcriptional repressor MraZ [Geomesophilobacter sediminis]MBJ6726659.1 division/cell wall cluster transcriptional repressor MraZ [Geomesophilobacter sediminis]
MFRGKFETTIDAKGRTSLPAKFREVLAETYGDDRFFLTRSNPVRLADGAVSYGLSIYPHKDFLALEEKLKTGTGLGLSSAELAAVKRTILVPAVECTADKLGRVLVPNDLRRGAFLEREILFVGMLNKVEIWSQAEWEKVSRQDEENFPTDSAALAELGL